MPNYRIVQELDGRFVIVNPADSSLCWMGSHWGYPDQGSQPLISFADRAAAENYARIILGGEKK